jgi:hypothetical protein
LDTLMKKNGTLCPGSVLGQIQHCTVLCITGVFPTENLYKLLGITSTRIEMLLSVDKFALYTYFVRKINNGILYVSFFPMETQKPFAVKISQ